jgi:hypothetical protein
VLCVLLHRRGFSFSFISLFVEIEKEKSDKKKKNRGGRAKWPFVQCICPVKPQSIQYRQDKLQRQTANGKRLQTANGKRL